MSVLPSPKRQNLDRWTSLNRILSTPKHWNVVKSISNRVLDRFVTRCENWDVQIYFHSRRFFDSTHWELKMSHVYESLGYPNRIYFNFSRVYQMLVLMSPNQTTLNWIQLIRLIKILEFVMCRTRDLELDYDVIVHYSLFMSQEFWPEMTFHNNSTCRIQKVEKF